LGREAVNCGEGGVPGTREGGSEGVG
jgi:hypothetical protein